MFSTIIKPGFSDSDALGHINNTKLPVWFENARDPIFKIFTPELDLENWPLILAKITVDFHKQLFLDSDIEIKTYIKKLGNASFTVTQQAWQNGTCAATGESIMVHFQYQSNKSVVIPDGIRKELQQHMLATKG